MICLILYVCCYISSGDLVEKEEKKPVKTCQIMDDFSFFYLFSYLYFYPFIFYNENIFLGFLLKEHDLK